MAVRSGFWNSVGTNRRTYYNHDFSHLISLLIKDGIHQNYGKNFIVKPGSGMEIIVQTGEAWFNDTWVLNDSDLVIAIDQAPIVGGFKRIDAIVIKIDASQSVMDGTIEYLKGSETAGTPVMPTMEDSDDIHWHLLATIEIAMGDSAISASKITNYVGTSRTPFISGILSTISADILMSKWQAEFNEWFDHMKGQLDEDPAGHLQLEVDDLQEEVDDLQEEVGTKVSKTGDTMTGALTIKNGANGNIRLWYHPSMPGAGFIIDEGDMANPILNVDIVSRAGANYGYMLHGGRAQLDWNDIKSLQDNKVDKVFGKGLSENDFTTARLTKLNGIAEGATKIRVKGNAESNYRVGDVNLTPANIGAVAKTGDTMTGSLNAAGLKSTSGWFDLVYNGATLANLFCNSGDSNVSLKATTSWLHLITPSILALQTNDRVNVTNVNGTAWQAIYAGSYPGPSSKLIKENIIDMDDDDGLNVLKLRPIHFDYKKNFGGNKNQCGLIAEEVLEVIPEVVNVPDGYDEKNFDEEKGALGNDVLGIDYAKLTPHIIKLCQIQQQEIDNLHSELETLRNLIKGE